MSERVKVLIVDDEAGFAVILKMSLEETCGYDVRVEHSGEKGLKTARHFRPDVILMDITLPDMSGTEVTRRIKSDAEIGKTPVIFVTATPTKQEDVDALAFACVIKPASASEIVECIRRCTRAAGK